MEKIIESTVLRARLRSPLPREFFDRDPQRVCRELLGKVLVREEGRRFGWPHRGGRGVLGNG